MESLTYGGSLNQTKVWYENFLLFHPWISGSGYSKPDMNGECINKYNVSHIPHSSCAIQSFLFIQSGTAEEASYAYIMKATAKEIPNTALHMELRAISSFHSVCKFDDHLTFYRNATHIVRLAYPQFFFQKDMLLNFKISSTNYTTHHIRKSNANKSACSL